MKIRLTFLKYLEEVGPHFLLLEKIKIILCFYFLLEHQEKANLMIFIKFIFQKKMIALVRKK